MLKNFFIIVILLQGTLVKAQLISDSLLIGNHYRVFLYNKPRSTQTGASLIFAMHGSGGKPQDMAEKAANLETKAVADNFILVYPAGYKHYWNECRKASTADANVENINEVAFFTGMIKYFKDKFQINEKHVFATGFSGGGHMSYSLGLSMTSKIKAISAIVANLPTPENMDCVESKMPLAVMITNGTADQTNPYNGGEVKIPGVSLGMVRATEQSFQYWANLDGYKGNPVKSIVPDADPSNDITIEKYTYQKKGQPEVTLLKVINGKHQWLTDMDVLEESWKFFKRQID